ncbi:MAG: secretion protein [Blastopirellula sp.]|nr:MAG: secretion protein [Blastopirellula sp.]
MDPQLVLILSGLMFAGCILLIVVLVARPTEHSAEDARLEGLSSIGSRAKGSRGGSRSGSNWAKSSDNTSSQSENSDMGDRMIQAGLYRRNSMSFYIASKVLFASVPILIGIAAGVTGVASIPVGIGVGLVLSLVGTLVPSFWLDAMKRKRQQQISRALPDALDVIVVCLEAGLSLRAAISRVAKELKDAHPMLAAELIIADREIQLGHSAGEALKRFAARFDLESIRSLASVVIQAEKFGASIASALRVHAEDLRIKRFQHAEELAQKASVKLLFPTMFCIFPTLYVVLLGPAVMELTTFFEKFGTGSTGIGP